MGLRESLSEQVSSYMSTAFANVSGVDSVASAARAMKKAGTTEAIVSKDGTPIGIVTERDILYKVVALGGNPSVVKVGEVMSSPVETIDETTTVGEAIAKMSKLGGRRLGVTRKGKLVGIVTQRAVVSDGVHQSVLLPELASPGKFPCPYCDTVLKTADELSKHIDQAHLGRGLLQGDVTKW